MAITTNSRRRHQVFSSTTRGDGRRGDDVTANVRTLRSVPLRLTAPPVEGAANRALVEFLADALDVPKSAVEIVAGARSREKRVRVAGMSAEALRSRLEQLAG